MQNIFGYVLYMADSTEFGASRFLFIDFDALFDTIVKIFSLDLMGQNPLGELYFKGHVRHYFNFTAKNKQKNVIFGHV